MTDLVPYDNTRQSTIELASSAWKLANTIHNTTFVPKALRGDAPAVLACILTGHELGIDAMQSLSKIHVIEGRPALSAELMRALILRAGHSIEFDEMNSERCIVRGRRREEREWLRVTFTMDDARRAQVTGKDNWKKWPMSMLTARATSILARAKFADVLAGVSYTVEELEDGIVDTDGYVNFGPPEQATTEPPARRRAPRGAVTRGEQPADQPAEAPVTRGEEPPLPEEAEHVTPEVVDRPMSNAAVEYPDPDDAFPVQTTSDASVDGPRLTGPQMLAMRISERFNLKGAAQRADRLRIVGLILGLDVPPMTSNGLANEQIGDALQTLDQLPDDVTTEAALVAWIEQSVSAGAPGSDGAPPAASETSPDPVPPPDEAPAETPPVDEVAERRRARTKPPEDWTADEWRKFLADRKVKVTEAIKRAQGLAAELADPITIVVLDDIAGSGIAVDLMGFVEDLSLERKK